jgi:hypothetical protein
MFEKEFIQLHGQKVLVKKNELIDINFNPLENPFEFNHPMEIVKYCQDNVAK